MNRRAPIKNAAGRFDSLWQLDAATGCHNWQGARAARYGFLYVGRVRWLAHRFSYARSKGPINPGQCVCHSCDNTFCVNPEHLWLGSQQDNLEDMRLKGRGGINGLKGEDVGTSKLTANQVREIKTALAAGGTQTAIANQFGVTQAAISLIKLGIRWGHIC